MMLFRPFFRLLFRPLRRQLCALLLAGLPTLSAHAAQPGAPIILVLGDSLSAEYGLARDTGWVALLAQRLAANHPEYRVVNASVSGETTSGGAARLPALLAEHRPRIVILELGGNDALRGLALDLTERNLVTMTTLARTAGAQALILGMQIPPNYGRPYAERFRQLFATVASAHHAALVPFLLTGFAEDPAYFQPDRIHPAAAAQPLMLANVWPALEPLL